MKDPLISDVATSLSLQDSSSSALLVGSGWMLSSMFLTTYYTTAFLKFEDHAKRNFGLPSMKSKMNSIESIESASARKGLTSSLTKISRAQLLTLFRFGGSALMGMFLNLDLFAVKLRVLQTISLMKEFSLPALFGYLANYCNSIALSRIGISLTYTSKCGIPLITVLFTVLLDGLGALPPVAALLSLLPIALGIALASWDSPCWEPIGFMAAIISCIAQAALNISSKRALTRTRVGGLDGQRAMATVAFIIASFSLLGESLLVHRRSGDTDKKRLPARNKIPPLSLSLAAVAAYHIEYTLSFLFLGLVKSISYGTCDAMRRLGIIIVGQWMFGGDRFSFLNLTGIALALLGAFSYSLNKN